MEVYHFARAQSFVKLYVLFNMLEIFERLLRSFGIDLIENLLMSAGRCCNGLYTNTHHGRMIWTSDFLLESIFFDLGASPRYCCHKTYEKAQQKTK